MALTAAIQPAASAANTSTYADWNWRKGLVRVSWTGSKAKFTERGLPMLMLNNSYWYIRDLIFGPRLCTTLALCTTIRSLTLALLPLSPGYCLCPAMKCRLPYGVADVRLILWSVPTVKAEPK